MSLIFNNVEPTDIIYNGTELTSVVFNGVEVWKKSTYSQGLIFANNCSSKNASYTKQTSGTYSSGTYYQYNFTTNTFDSVTLAKGDSLVGYYAYSSAGSYYSVIGYEGTDTDVIIPETINGTVVTCITDGAFSNTNITSLTFGTNIITIGSNIVNSTPLYNNSTNWENGCLKIMDAYIIANSYTITIPSNIRLLGSTLCGKLVEQAMNVTLNSNIINNIEKNKPFNQGDATISSISGNAQLTIGSNVTTLFPYSLNFGLTYQSVNYAQLLETYNPFSNTNVTTLKAYSLTKKSVYSPNLTIPSYAILEADCGSSGNFKNGLIINCNIPSNAFAMPQAGADTGFSTIEIGANVSSIGSLAFSTPLGLTTLTFKQPLGMAITLPTAGSTSGMFYTKSAMNVTIYTDNETIKNYDWATDNITATFKHLDGTDWT